MYVLFGVFFFIFRLFTRGGRKNKREKLRHREVLDAIERRKTLWTPSRQNEFDVTSTFLLEKSK